MIIFESKNFVFDNHYHFYIYHAIKIYPILHYCYNDIRCGRMWERNGL